MTWLAVVKGLCLLGILFHAAYLIRHNLSDKSSDKTNSKDDTEIYGRPSGPKDISSYHDFEYRLPITLTQKSFPQSFAWKYHSVVSRLQTFFRKTPQLRTAKYKQSKFSVSKANEAFLSQKSCYQPPQDFWSLCKSTWLHLKDINGLWDYALESPLVLGHFLLVAFVEEIMWRVAGQSILIELFRSLLSPLNLQWQETIAASLGILIIAILFSVSHKHFFENTLLVSTEFLGFAILLGVLYYWTSSFILVLIIHAVRDIEITFLEYQIRMEEIGNREKAVREVEQSVVKELRKRQFRPKLRNLIMQVPGFYLSCFLGFWEYNAFTRELISPVHIAVGLVLGHLIFGVSLLITLHSAEKT